MKLIALKPRPLHGKTVHVGESFRVADVAEARKLVETGEAKCLPGQSLPRAPFKPEPRED